MAGNILIGIDLGTTVLKVCAFDARTGAVRAQAQRRLAVHADPDGRREQDPRSVDAAFRALARQLRNALGRAWRRVEGIGVAAQGGSTIVADRATGVPRTPMILWNDNRARDEHAWIMGRTTRRFWRERVLVETAPAGLGRLFWLTTRQPELFGSDRIHVGAGEYLFFGLTGVWRQDPGNAIQIGSYNVVKRQLDPSMLALAGVSLEFVARLRQGHETSPLSTTAARLFDLPAGIPVAGPYIDQEAGYLSAAGAGRCPLQCSLGTAWVGNFRLPDETTGGSPFQLVLPSPIGKGRLVVQPLLTGNVTWDWALDTFVDLNRAKALAKVDEIFAQSLLAPEGLIAVPWLAQWNPLGYGPGAGTFFGVNAQTQRADLVRAVAAGMTFELARVFDEVKRAGAVDSVVLGGGASKGGAFRALIASLFAPLPVLQQTDQDLATARGAIYAFGPHAACSETRPVSAPPEEVSAGVRDRYEEYLHVFKSLYGRVQIGNPFQFRATTTRR